MSTIVNPTELGMAIHQARKRHKLTQEQLAATCGLGIRFIRELEQGKPSCHLGKALLVLQMLGLTLHLQGG